MYVFINILGNSFAVIVVAVFTITAELGSWCFRRCLLWQFCACDGKEKKESTKTNICTYVYVCVMKWKKVQTLLFDYLCKCFNFQC